jgi:hypothetical protein
MTVPYGGDVANPMVQGGSGPGKGGYVLGGLLIALGIIGGIAWGVINGVDFVDAVDDFQRTPVGRVGTVDLDRGDYVIYGEKGGGDGITAVLASVRMRPSGEEGNELDIEEYEAEFTYDVGNRNGRAEFTVEIPDDGEYEILAEGISSGATTVAVGPSVAGKLVSAIVGALLIGGIGVVVGVILMIVTGVRRRKFRQRGWLDGWNQPGTPQGQWNPPGTWSPPAPGGYGTPPPPAGSGWNPPPPPPGSSF